MTQGLRSLSNSLPSSGWVTRSGLRPDPTIVGHLRQIAIKKCATFTYTTPRPVSDATAKNGNPGISVACPLGLRLRGDDVFVVHRSS